MKAGRAGSLWGIVVCVTLTVSSHLFADPASDYTSSTSQSCTVSLQPHEQQKRDIELHCELYHQTTNYTCGPAAIMTLMHYYGKLSQAEMNQKTELRIAMEMGASSEGTTQSQMANWLSGHGFTVDSGERAESRMIVDNLKSGKPTLLGVNNHWILAKGFTKGESPEKGQILFSDSCCGVSIMSCGDIDAMWLEAQLQGSSCGGIGQYIVATPR